jgi:hypothetical protein
MSDENIDETSPAATSTANYGSVSSPDKMYLDDFYEKIGNQKLSVKIVCRNCTAI